jgi:broad specificity phosphatase PhoE
MAMALQLPSLAMAETKFIYLTRHAEKAVSTSNDPPLSAEGKTRAQNIASTLKSAGIKHIYSTAYQRTQQTAQPLSALLSIPVQSYDAAAAQLPAFADRILALPGNTWVVGHSDTTPALIRELGGDPGSEIAETEFDRLYQLAIAENGTVTTTLLRSIPSPIVLPCAPVTMTYSGLSAPKEGWLYYTIDVPECANKLTVTTAGGTGDADLYTRAGARPTTSSYTCSSTANGNAETCVTNNPAAGIWHIAIRPYSAISGVTLTATAVQ